MTQIEKMDRLKQYMKDEFQVTPENIDEKLQLLRKEIQERGEVIGKYQRIQ